MVDDLVYPHEDSHTTLINIKNTNPDAMDFYIGEDHESYDLDESPLKNPFDKSELGREIAVKHYKMYLYRRYLEEERFRKLLHSIEGDTLGCLCYPKRCHGEVIVDLLNEHNQNGIQGSINLMENRLNDIDEESLGKEGFREYEATIDALNNVKKEYEL
jgi:predicted transcriptional regulator with HTH domain